MRKHFWIHYRLTDSSTWECLPTQGTMYKTLLHYARMRTADCDYSPSGLKYKETVASGFEDLLVFLKTCTAALKEK